MKQLLLLSFLLAFGLSLFAQEPLLTTKDILQTQLLDSPKKISASSESDILKITDVVPPVSDDYTLEIKGKVVSASGRGMDIEARNKNGVGFRTTMNENSLKWAIPLNAGEMISQTDNTQNDQTIRYAVKEGSVYIYHNGYYVGTKKLDAVYDIRDGIEQNEFIKGDNLTADWAGSPSDRAGAPTAYGWSASGGTIPWNTANSGSGVRYLDVSETVNKHTLDGATYNGRIMFIRWDNNAYSSAVYTYPVTLEANTSYELSLLMAYWSNSGGSKSITVGLSPNADGSDPVVSQLVTTGNQGVLSRSRLTASIATAGKYYITLTGDWALYSVGEVSVNKITSDPHFIFGKNYPDGEVDMTLSAVSFDDSGAYAPIKKDDSRTEVTLSDAGIVSLPNISFSNYTVSGKTELHLQTATPFINGSVDLISDDSWLFVERVKPSVFVSEWLSNVKVNGVPATYSGVAPNVRIAIYGTGTLVIPNGKVYDSKALEVFTEPNFGGNSQTYKIDSFHKDLGAFNNAIRSFKLKRGYMATLANKKDGTGFSRVFIADKEDLEVAVMPQGLDATVSFIRIFRWDWVSKKGLAGGGNLVKQSNSTWFYDWNIGGESTNIDFNYVAIRQTAYWPDWNSLYNKAKVNHLMGYNEPDHVEQSNVSVETAIEQWPEMMKAGMRLGSPAVTDNNWLYRFIEECDKRNFRVDFVVYHAYWGGKSTTNWYNDLRNVSTTTKRKVWLKEWNLGANWTTESWPDPTGPRRDADMNIIYDGQGNTTTVNRPLSPSNSAKQVAGLTGVLSVLDSASFMERYSIYNWVEDARAIELSGKLTPSGKLYAENPSVLAYSGEYEHKWKLVAPIVTYKQLDDYSGYKFSWTDFNGETARGYVAERKVGSNNWEAIGDTIDGDWSDNPYKTLSFSSSVPASCYFRVKAIGWDGAVVASSALFMVADTALTSPVVNGEGVSTSWIKLKWEPVTGAKTYRIMRATMPDSVYVTLRDTYNKLEYDDTGLRANTTYYYIIHAVNSTGLSPANPLRVMTRWYTGIDSPEDEGAVTSLYPNPVNAGEPLRIDRKDRPEDSGYIEVYSVGGSLILRQSLSETLYAPKGKGTYIVKVTSSSRVEKLKLIVI